MSAAISNRDGIRMVIVTRGLQDREAKTLATKLSYRLQFGVAFGYAQSYCQ